MRERKPQRGVQISTSLSVRNVEQKRMGEVSEIWLAATKNTGDRTTLYK